MSSNRFNSMTSTSHSGYGRTADSSSANPSSTDADPTATSCTQLFQSKPREAEFTEGWPPIPLTGEWRKNTANGHSYDLSLNWPDGTDRRFDGIECGSLAGMRSHHELRTEVEALGLRMYDPKKHHEEWVCRQSKDGRDTVGDPSDRSEVTKNGGHNSTIKGGDVPTSMTPSAWTGSTQVTGRAAGGTTTSRATPSGQLRGRGPYY